MGCERVRRKLGGNTFYRSAEVCAAVANIGQLHKDTELPPPPPGTGPSETTQVSWPMQILAWRNRYTDVFPLASWRGAVPGIVRQNDAARRATTGRRFGRWVESHSNYQIAARELGVGWREIRAWVSGKSSPTADMLLAIKRFTRGAILPEQWV